MNPCLYYRSDTRTPAHIFTHGFKTRHQRACPAGHFRYALRKRHMELQVMPVLGQNFKPLDADPNYAVAFSRDIEAAAMFPVVDSAGVIQTSYLYAIELPEAIAITPDMRYSSPKLEDNKPFDLYPLQREHARKVMQTYEKFAKFYDPKAMCLFLNAKECFTKNISATNIVAAIQIQQKLPDVEKVEIFHLENFQQHHSFEMLYKVESREVMVNPNFHHSDSSAAIIQKMEAFIKQKSGAFFSTPKIETVELADLSVKQADKKTSSSVCAIQ